MCIYNVYIHIIYITVYITITLAIHQKFNNIVSQLYFNLKNIFFKVKN